MIIRKLLEIVRCQLVDTPNMNLLKLWFFAEVNRGVVVGGGDGWSRLLSRHIRGKFERQVKDRYDTD